MRLAVSAGELMKAVEMKTVEGNRKQAVPAFQPGDTIRLQLRVPEGDKERQQSFEGIVIGRRGGGSREMVVVRRISFGIGVERIFPLHSPFVTRIEVVSKGRVRRSKLYFLRDKTGKAAKLKQEIGGGQAEQEAVEVVQETPEEATAREAKKVAKKAKKAEKKAAKK